MSAEDMINDNGQAMSTEDMMSYRDGFKNVLRLVVFESMAIVVLLAVVFYYISNVHPNDRYFAENSDGTKKQMVGLAQPNMNQDAVVTWASAAVTQIMTFGFNDIDESMAKAKKDFTPEGWESFSSALKKTSLLHTILDNQQLLTSVPISTPQIIREGMIGSEYVWIINMSIVMTTRAADKKSTALGSVRLILTKMPTVDNPMGIGIKAFFLY